MEWPGSQGVGFEHREVRLFLYNLHHIGVKFRPLGSHQVYAEVIVYVPKIYEWLQCILYKYIRPLDWHVEVDFLLYFWVLRFIAM